MNFAEYQTTVNDTAIYPNTGNNIVYPVLGLAGEAGEVAEAVKKAFRDHDGVFDDERRQKLKLELGDVLWYVTRIAAELGFDLEAVARANVEKLASRKARGVLGGSGDNR